MLRFKGENESQVWSPVPIIEVQNIRPIRGDHEMENEDHLHTLVSLQFLVPSSFSWALIFRVGCHALLQGNLSNPGREPRSPALQVDSLPTGPPGKPLKTETKPNWLDWLHVSMKWLACASPWLPVFLYGNDMHTWWEADATIVSMLVLLHSPTSTPHLPHTSKVLWQVKLRVNYVASLKNPLHPQFDLIF